MQALMPLIIQLVIDTLFSWTRMFIALGISVALSLVIGIYMALNSKAEKILLPLIDIFQTLPIVAFFPFVIYVVVTSLPINIGINASIIILIITSMVWNIIFGVYESISTLPKEILEVAEIYHMNLYQRIKEIFIPASLQKVVWQSVLSWSIGLFYLVPSEMFLFSSSNTTYPVPMGIGVALTQYANDPLAYGLGILIFIIFVVATRLFFFKPLEDYAGRHTRAGAPQIRTRPIYQRVPSWFIKYLPVRNISSIITTRFIKMQETRLKKEEAKSSEKKGTKKGYKFFPNPFHTIAATLVSLLILLFVLDKNILTYEPMVLISLILSFVRIWLAFAVMLAISIPLCIYLIFIKGNSTKYIILFQILASIPASILLPVLASNLGHSLGGEAVAFIIFLLSGIWYIIFGIISNSGNIPNSIFEVKKVFGVSGISSWKKIYIKAIIPGIITGSITAVGAEWNASIVAEYFTSSGISNSAVLTSVGSGIGKLLDLSVVQGNLTLLFLALINLTVMILLINTFVWKRLYKKTFTVYR